MPSGCWKIVGVMVEEKHITMLNPDPSLSVDLVANRLQVIVGRLDLALMALAECRLDASSHIAAAQIAAGELAQACDAARRERRLDERRAGS